MFLVFDIGGTNCRIAAFEALNSVRPLFIEYFKINNDFNKDFEEIKRILDSKEISNCKYISIGIAGTLNSEKTGLLSSVNLKGWESYDLHYYFSKLYNCKVIIRNDTYMAALGEYSKLKVKKDFWYINWGTGIGGALTRIVNNKWNVYESELGHQRLLNKGDYCRCGQRGCLDSIASGFAIYNKYNREATKLNDKEWNEILPFIVQGITNIIMISPVELIIMGGGIVINKPEIVDNIYDNLNQYMHNYIPPRIRISTLKDLSGIYGAFELIRNEFQA